MEEEDDDDTFKRSLRSDAELIPDEEEEGVRRTIALSDRCGRLSRAAGGRRRRRRLSRAAARRLSGRRSWDCLDLAQHKHMSLPKAVARHIKGWE